jgi:hypothetical protein
VNQKTKDWIYVGTMLSLIGIAWYYFRLSAKRGEKFDDQLLENLRASIPVIIPGVVIPNDASEIENLPGGDFAS